MSKGHLTAITRKSMSKPTKWLVGKGLLTGRVLDYGCGKGLDAELLGAESYDPHFQPNMPVGKFDTIFCNYVLNVIPDLTERKNVVSLIESKLESGGNAYISVRNDRSALNGYTKRGTWQGLIVLDLPIVAKNANFTVFRLEGAR